MSENENVEDRPLTANEVSRWLHRTGFEKTELGVDFVDLIDAAHVVERALKKVVRSEPPGLGREMEYHEIATLYAWLFTELKYHLEELEKDWNGLEAHLGQGLEEDEGVDEHA